MTPPFNLYSNEIVTIRLSLTIVSRAGRVQGNDYEGWYCSLTGDSYVTLQELVEHQLRRDIEVFDVQSVSLLDCKR